MNIRGKYWMATGGSFAVLAAMAAAIFWMKAEVDTATDQRRQTTLIARELTALRLVTFEYVLNRPERARVQWFAVSARIDGLIAQNHFYGPEQMDILARLRERRAAAPRIFSEFVATASGARDLPDDRLQRHFEAQMLSRLVIGQQDSLADAFRLTELSTERIEEAQRRAAQAVFAGLALIAFVTAGGAWLMQREVLAPILRLQRAARELGAGNWKIEVAVAGNDEVGELSKNFNAMTRSLRTAFDAVESGNRELDLLNHELEAFSYSVSHDLRGPLRSMDGFSLVLLEDYGAKLDAEGRDALERIRAASQRMGQLIDDLLALSQVTRSELNIHGVDVGAMAREIAQTIEQEEPGRTVEWRIENGMNVQADKALMRVALKNLLHNAFKFTGKTEHATIHVGARERDGCKEIFVSDNGAGFDMAYAERLFGAFQRLHHASDFPGTGIGLAIVQRVIRRHKGQIRAEAKLGHGATFFFTLGT